MKRFIAILLLLLMTRAPVPGAPFFVPTISGLNVAVNCTTSVLINFNTTTPSYASLDYGLTAGYGSSTLSDSTRYYKEHAIQITGLTPNTLYHYRVVATDASGTTIGGDQTFTTRMAGTACPNLPAEVDSRMPDMSGAVEKTVCNTNPCASGASRDYTPAQFQNALNDAGTANEKRIITVDAGVSVVNQWTMPVNADQNWIVIRSSAYAQLPEGKRVMINPDGSFDATQSTKMFRILNTNVDPTIIFAAGSNHIRFIGAEVTIDPSALADAPGGPEQSGLINMQANVRGNAANLAKFIGFDRCYIHGLFNKNTRRGIYFEGEDLFVIDSFLYDFHSSGDAQAILAATTKRHRILNNTIIGSGENYMWGGTGLSVPGYVVSGLEYLRNHMYHPIAWKPNGPSYGGFDWIEKNLFELKTSAKAFVFGNYFGGTSTSQGGYWPDAQSVSINLKLEQNSAGPTTCDLMEDILFYKNYGRNLHAGVTIVGRTTSAQGCTNRAERVWFLHNQFELNATFWTPEPDCQSCTWNATGWALWNTYDMQIVHNTTVNANPTQGTCTGTLFTSGNLLLTGDPQVTKYTGFVFKDNVNDNRGCGVAGGGFNSTNATGSLDGVYTGWIFTNNGIMRAAGAQPGLPAGNVNATTWTTQVVNFNSGLGGNYTIAPGSTWDNAASDGTDIGADIAANDRAVEFTPVGLWSSGSVAGSTVCKWSTNPPCQ